VRECGFDGLQNRFGFEFHLFACESQHADSLSTHPPVALRVVTLALGSEMVFAVDFHHEFSRGAIEVGNVGAERVLAAEFQLHQVPVAQQLP